MGHSGLKTIHVRTAPGRGTRGWLMAGPRAFPVALGRGGILANKREGDGGTPRGVFRPLRLWWRADRGPRPRTRLPVRRIAAGGAGRPGGRLVRGPGRPALQSANDDGGGTSR